MEGLLRRLLNGFPEFNNQMQIKYLEIELRLDEGLFCRGNRFDYLND